MKVFQPDSITPNAELALAGRSLGIGTFHYIGKSDNKAKTDERLYILSGESTVINEVKLSSELITDLDTLLGNMPKAVKGKSISEEDLDTAKDAVLASKIGQFFTRFRAVKGKSVEESFLSYLPTVTTFIRENYNGKLKDSMALATKSCKTTSSHLVGKKKSVTREELLTGFAAIVTPEFVAMINALPRNDKGYIQLKQALVKDPNAAKKVVKLNTSPADLLLANKPKAKK